MQIQCSNCGATRSFKYSAGNVLRIVGVNGWNSCGSALYCPKCSKTWHERNGSRPLASQENTMARIDAIRQREGG